MNHSAAPIRPPTATAVTGTAKPRIPASTNSPDIGRLRATMPVVSCGANRVSVAAAVNAVAPSAPIMNPSNDSRVGGRTSRISTAGMTISTRPPTGTPRPLRNSRYPVMPEPSGTP